MSVFARRVWRIAPGTRVLVWLFVVLAGVSIPALAYLLYRDEGERWLALGLVALAAACLLYAWRFGLHPRLVAAPDGVSVVNPGRRAHLDWEDITVVAPGEDGLVVGSPEQQSEAWCVQKSTRAARRGRRTRADAVADELTDLLEAYAPLPSDDTTGLRIRRARADEVRRLARMERAASGAALAHVFPPERHPYPMESVVARWQRLLRDGGVWVVILELFDAPVGYLAYSVDTVLHLGVAPSQTRRGYGSALLEYATAEIFSGGAPEARLWVLDQNTSARAFYDAHGWQLTDESRESPYPPHPTESVWVRRNPAAPRRRR